MSRRSDVLTAPITVDGFGHPLTFEQPGDDELLDVMLSPQQLAEALEIGVGHAVARCILCGMLSDRVGRGYKCRWCRAEWWSL